MQYNKKNPFVIFFCLLKTDPHALLFLVFASVPLKLIGGKRLVTDYSLHFMFRNQKQNYFVCFGLYIEFLIEYLHFKNI